MVEKLYACVQDLDDAAFNPAMVGRISVQQRNELVRTDAIHWIDGVKPATQDYLQTMEDLRQQLNRHLFLGLFEYECHFARYLQGCFYRRHLDAFQGNMNRVVSSVLYLNPDWSAADGGELVLYTGGQGGAVQPAEVRILPTFGTMVFFLSEKFPHEVLPARKTRYSIAGWFRINRMAPANILSA
jgi:SM-20-related protein